MKRSLMTAASVVALTLALPAFADQNVNVKIGAEGPATRTQAEAEVNNDLGQDIKKGWEKTKDAVSEAAHETKEALTPDAEIQADADVRLDKNRSADAMIGSSVQNDKGETVGKVDDIIVDSKGRAKMVIVGDGDLIGLGKKVAVDYNSINSLAADGKVIAPLSEAKIDSKAAFSYENAGGYRVSELIGAPLVDAQGESVGKVKNIAFKNGRADKLVVAYDQVLGLGGETAAWDYSDLELTSSNKADTKFRLSKAQTKQFIQFKAKQKAKVKSN